MTERPPVETPEFYRMEKTKLEPGFLVTAALLSCGLCGVTISGNGGPGGGQVCIRCGDELARGGLRGAVIWEEG